MTIILLSIKLCALLIISGAKVETRSHKCIVQRTPPQGPALQWLVLTTLLVSMLVISRSFSVVHGCRLQSCSFWGFRSTSHRLGSSICVSNSSSVTHATYLVSLPSPQETEHCKRRGLISISVWYVAVLIITLALHESYIDHDLLCVCWPLKRYITKIINFSPTWKHFFFA